MNVETSSKIKGFGLNSGGGDDIHNPNSGALTHHLTFSTSNPINDKSDKVKAINVTVVFTINKVSTHMI